MMDILPATYNNNFPPVQQPIKDIRANMEKFKKNEMTIRTMGNSHIIDIQYVQFFCPTCFSIPFISLHLSSDIRLVYHFFCKSGLLKSGRSGVSFQEQQFQRKENHHDLPRPLYLTN